MAIPTIVVSEFDQPAGKDGWLFTFETPVLSATVTSFNTGSSIPVLG